MFSWLNDDDYVVVAYLSRNKDNKEVENFKERRRTRLCKVKDLDLYDDFDEFVRRGRPGEFCRCYISQNARDMKRVRKKLLHFLVDTDEFDPVRLEAKVAGLAAESDCALTKRWFFDFDLDDEAEKDLFVEDVYGFMVKGEVESFKAPHGWAVCVDHGFDTRALLDRWGEVATLKRDDLVCVDWEKNY